MRLPSVMMLCNMVRMMAWASRGGAHFTVGSKMSKLKISLRMLSRLSGGCSCSLARVLFIDRQRDHYVYISWRVAGKNGKVVQISS